MKMKSHIKQVARITFFYLYEVLGPGREDLSGMWSVS